LDLDEIIEQSNMYNTCRYLGARLEERTYRGKLVEQIDRMTPVICRELEPILRQSPDPLELARLLGAIGIFQIQISKQKIFMVIGKKLACSLL